MTDMITRRGLIGSIGALLAAPAIVRASSLMPIKALPHGAWVRNVEEIEFLKGMSQEIAHRFIYLNLNPELVPLSFSGFAPFYYNPIPFEMELSQD